MSAYTKKAQTALTRLQSNHRQLARTCEGRPQPNRAPEYKHRHYIAQPHTWTPVRRGNRRAAVRRPASSLPAIKAARPFGEVGCGCSVIIPVLQRADRWQSWRLTSSSLVHQFLIDLHHSLCRELHCLSARSIDHGTVRTLYALLPHQPV